MVNYKMPTCKKSKPVTVLVDILMTSQTGWLFGKSQFMLPIRILIFLLIMTRQTLKDRQTELYLLT